MPESQRYAYFAPGKSMSGELPFDLREGFTLMAALKVNVRDAEGQQTIFLFEGEDREIAEFFVERDGRLVFGVGPASVSILPNESAPYLGRWSVFLISCLVSGDQVSLELEIDGKVKASDKQTWSGTTQLTRWIQGGGKADFGLRLVVLWKGVAEYDARERMRDGIQQVLP